jgi:putative inorganic carbon (hco3(-)) transporter
MSSLSSSPGRLAFPASAGLDSLGLALAIGLLGLLLAWLPLDIAALLVMGGVFFILVLIYPPLILYGLILVIPFSTLLALPLSGFKIGLMEVMLGLGLSAASLKLMAAQSLTGQPLKLKAGPWLGALLFFLAGVSLSWLNTFSLSGSFVETAKWLEVLVLYLFIVNFLPLNQVKWAIMSLLLAGMAQALLGLYQFLYKAGPEGFLLFEGRFLRAYGTFDQPNPYGGYLGLILPLALALALWGFEALPGPAPNFMRRSLHSLLRVMLFSLPLTLLLAALFASQSRGAWLGFAGGALLVLLIYSKKTALLLTFSALILALLGLAGSFNFTPSPTGSGGIGQAYSVVIQRLEEAVVTLTTTSDVAHIPVTDANFATLERLAHWQAARAMWRDNFWLGVGFGNYAAVYPAYAVGRWLDPLGHAHNYPLNLAAETGLIGITGYLIFWILTFGVLWRVVNWNQGFYRAVAVGGMGILAHLHLHNMVDNLYIQGMYLHLAIVLGLISVIAQRHQKKISNT